MGQSQRLLSGGTHCRDRFRGLCPSCAGALVRVAPEIGDPTVRVGAVQRRSRRSFGSCAFGSCASVVLAPGSLLPGGGNASVVVCPPFCKTTSRPITLLSFHPR